MDLSSGGGWPIKTSRRGSSVVSFQGGGARRRGQEEGGAIVCGDSDSRTSSTPRCPRDHTEIGPCERETLSLVVHEAAGRAAALLFMHPPKQVSNSTHVMVHVQIIMPRETNACVLHHPILGIVEIRLQARFVSSLEIAVVAVGRSCSAVTGPLVLGVLAFAQRHKTYPAWRLRNQRSVLCPLSCVSCQCP